MKKYIIQFTFEAFGAIREDHIYTDQRLFSEEVQKLVSDHILNIVPTAHLLTLKVHEINHTFTIIGHEK